MSMKTPVLQETDHGLVLAEGDMELICDFTRLLPRVQADALNRELLVRAAKIRDFGGKALALDATAGLGEDSFLLAAAGFQVELFEYNEIIAALLRDGIKRGLEDPALRDIVSRMHLNEENSIKAMQRKDLQPDLILLDPMFPRRNTSGISKKKLQMFKQLERPCEEEQEMLEAALGLRPYKIIVKRPLKGPCLGDRKPGYSIEGKTIRYDCLVFPR
ncbi:MAG: class I SAM-dependent methyltransferase [Lachnospiraceae bacterium]|nr:class I SAM-dependent methyltransferase [Lachnospiraceae bacterium]